MRHCEAENSSAETVLPLPWLAAEVVVADSVVGNIPAVRYLEFQVLVVATKMWVSGDVTSVSHVSVLLSHPHSNQPHRLGWVGMAASVSMFPPLDLRRQYEAMRANKASCMDTRSKLLHAGLMGMFGDVQRAQTCMTSIAHLLKKEDASQSEMDQLRRDMETIVEQSCSGLAELCAGHQQAIQGLLEHADQIINTMSTLRSSLALFGSSIKLHLGPILKPLMNIPSLIDHSDWTSAKERATSATFQPPPSSDECTALAPLPPMPPMPTPQVYAEPFTVLNTGERVLEAVTALSHHEIVLLKRKEQIEKQKLVLFTTMTNNRELGSRHRVDLCKAFESLMECISTSLTPLREPLRKVAEVVQQVKSALQSLAPPGDSCEAEEEEDNDPQVNISRMLEAMITECRNNAAVKQLSSEGDE